jgi:hypothetical protein
MAAAIRNYLYYIVFAAFNSTCASKLERVLRRLMFHRRGRRGIIRNYHKQSPQITQIATNYKNIKKIWVICVICGHLLKKVENS